MADTVPNRVYLLMPQAMILAAGRGERLRPSTDRCPKPLLPVRGKPLIEWQIEGLVRAGFDEIVVNGAWLAESLEAFLAQGQRWGIPLHWSREAQALGTAGKVFNLGYRIDTPLQGMPTTVINYLGQATTFIPGVTGPIPINDLTSVKQWDISGQWPITSRLSFLGRLAYSTLDNQVLEALTGVEYNAGCWALRVISSRFPVSPIQTDTAFYVQLELGPLGLGPNPLDTLRYNIPGYTKTNEISPQ